MTQAPIIFEHDSLGPRLRRCVDLVFLALVAPIAIPLIFVLALAVKVDSAGPAYWGHERVGRDGRRFRLFKLRTMSTDAEQRKLDLTHLNTLAWPDFKIPNDPRVTRLGRWLRRTSLDELPQLWNLLRGELTLVGPRACSVPVDRYELWQTERLDVTPGLFGRWQAEGRGRVDFNERCRIDIDQVHSPGPISETRLAVKTIVALASFRDNF